MAITNHERVGKALAHRRPRGATGSATSGERSVRTRPTRARPIPTPSCIARATPGEPAMLHGAYADLAPTARADISASRWSVGRTRVGLWSPNKCALHNGRA